LCQAQAEMSYSYQSRNVVFYDSAIVVVFPAKLYYLVLHRLRYPVVRFSPPGRDGKFRNPPPSWPAEWTVAAAEGI